MLPGPLDLSLGWGWFGVDPKWRDFFSPEQGTCIVDWFQPPWAGLVWLLQKKGKHQQKSRTPPEFWDKSQIKSQMLGPGNFYMKLLPGSHSHSPIAT